MSCRFFKSIQCVKNILLFKKIRLGVTQLLRLIYKLVRSFVTVCHAILIINAFLILLFFCRVKFGIPLEDVCKNDIPGPLLVSLTILFCAIEEFVLVIVLRMMKMAKLL